MTGAHDDFDRLAISAGIPDIPRTCRPLRADDVMQRSSELVLVDQGDADPGPSTTVCGFGTGLCKARSGWSETLILVLDRTPEVAKVFDPGPGRTLEISWSLGTVSVNGPVVVFCSIATQSDSDRSPRRFTIIIPPIAAFVAEFADAVVFALTLLDEDDDGEEDANLMWFVENDPGTWAALPPHA